MWVRGYPVLSKPRPAETRQFVLKARRPKFGRLYTDLAYRPMVELLAYLGADGFTTWICSGGRQDFVAAVSYEMYVFPPDQVIGSTLKKEEVEKYGKRVTWRFPEVTSATGLSSEAFAQGLLEEERVAVIPGSAFGPSGEGHVRACYATSYEQLEDALGRIGRFVDRHRA